MKLVYDADKLAKELRTKRCVVLRYGLRQAAKEIGISPATLSRAENMREPDVTTLANLCQWVQLPMEDFFRPDKDNSKQSKRKQHYKNNNW
jgi:transcriptional regulator with XRE-family HTH domain